MGLVARFRRAKLIRGLDGIELPSFSPAVLRAIYTLRTGDASLSEIGKLIAADPRCSVRLLRMTNSAGSGLKRKIESVAHAASVLGREKLEVVLIAAAVSSAVPNPNTATFDRRAFWQLAAQRATLARSLAERTDPAHATAAFTAALLQDLALPFLAIHHGERYTDLLAAAGGDHQLHCLERETFGWDHTEVTYDLARAWELPDSLAESIRDHHGDADIAAVSLVSDIDNFVDRAHQRFSIAEDELDAMRLHAIEESSELVSALC